MRNVLLNLIAVLLVFSVQGCWAGETKNEISQEGRSIESDPIETAIETEYETKKYNECLINGRGCLEKSEEEVIADNNMVSRSVDGDKGDLLEIKASEKTVLLRDGIANVHGEQDLKYRYIGYFPEVGYHLVTKRQYGGESISYILISQKTGKQFHMFGPPNISPDRNRFVAVRATESGDKNEIVVWRITQSELIEEYRYQPEIYALYRFLKWESERSIKLASYRDSGKELCGNGGRIKTIEVLEMKDSDWDLRLDTILSKECF